MAGDFIEADGVVTQWASNLAHVEVEIAGKTRTVLCKRAGRMAQHRIWVVVGDRVRVEISPFDLSRGRIAYRYDNKERRLTP